MAQCRHNQSRFKTEWAQWIRCTPEIDFLRGEPGSVVTGDFLDDTSLSLLSIKMVKAFLDVGLYESMACARWGATKWVQNEPRGVADSTYDDGVPLPPSFVNQVHRANHAGPHGRNLQTWSLPGQVQGTPLLPPI